MLTAIGGVLGGTGIVGLSGTTAANQLRAATLRGSANVYDSCGGSKIGEVGSEEGDVYDSCTGPDGWTWYYVSWDDAYPNGWTIGGKDVAVYK